MGRFVIPRIIAGAVASGAVLFARDAQAGQLDVLSNVSIRIQGCASEGSSLLGTLLDPVTFPQVNSATACGGSLLLDLAFLGMLVITVIVVVRIRHRTEERRLELVRGYIERGMEPPVSLFPSSARVDLRRGIVLMATGLGMLAASMVAHEATAIASFGPAGLIPGFIGLGYLVSYTVSRLTARGEASTR
ncbi:MAG: hypothetical protein KC636_38070 [Myxococcales bacterium]|nr:hypothetical protein [Myxococcales bacterium]